MADTDTDPGCSDEVRRNLQLLLALSPCISGADFKKTYKDQFGLDFDLHGGNLMEALEPYVRLGICTIEKRLVPRGSTLQFIHRAITADGPNFEVGYLLERYDDHTGQIFPRDGDEFTQPRLFKLEDCVEGHMLEPNGELVEYLPDFSDPSVPRARQVKLLVLGPCRNHGPSSTSEPNWIG